MTRLQELSRASPLFFSFTSKFQVFRNAGNSHSRAGNTLCSRSQAHQCSSGSGKPGLEQGGVELASSRFPRGSGSLKFAFKTARAATGAASTPAAPDARPPRPAGTTARVRAAFHARPRSERYLRSRAPRARPSPLLPGRRSPRGRRRGRLGRLGRLQRRPLQLFQLLQRHRLEGQDLGLAQHQGCRVLHRQLPCRGRKRPWASGGPDGQGRAVLAAGTLLGQHLPERSRPLRHGGSGPAPPPGTTTAPSLHCAAPCPRTPLVPPRCVLGAVGLTGLRLPQCALGVVVLGVALRRGRSGRGGSGSPGAVPGFRDAAPRLSCAGLCSEAEPSHLRGPARPGEPLPARLPGPAAELRLWGAFMVYFLLL